MEIHHNVTKPRHASSYTEQNHDTQSFIAKLRKADQAIADNRAHLLEADKHIWGTIMKFILPLIVGFISNKISDFSWKKMTRSNATPQAENTDDKLIPTLIFAIISAIISTLAFRYSTKATETLAKRRRKNK